MAKQNNTQQYNWINISKNLVLIECKMEEEKKVCHECIGETYVKSFIKKHGKRNGGCSYCLRFRKSLPYGVIAEMMHTVFESHYEPNFEPEIYFDTPKGDDAAGVIHYELQTDDEFLVSDIYDFLKNEYNPFRMDEFEKYNDDHKYVKVDFYSDSLDLAWDKMLESLKSEARYFNKGVKDFLDELFSDINTYKTKGSSSALREIEESTVFFRARVFDSISEVEKALKHPELEFGPPPSKIARAGRMNASGIPVFYGAASAEVAIAEVRPAVGSYVVVAPFEALRVLRVLDISSLELISHESGSKFDPEATKRLEKSSFLRTLSKILTIPVPGRNAENEYLITQAVSEYLSINDSLKLDGVTFNSTQVRKGSNRSADKYNIVLFKRSSVVRNADDIRCEYKVEMQENVEDDIYIFNPTIRKIEYADSDGKVPFLRIRRATYHPGDVLKLKVDDISFFKVEGVVFQVKERKINLGSSIIIKDDGVGFDVHL